MYVTGSWMTYGGLRHRQGFDRNAVAFTEDIWMVYFTDGALKWKAVAFIGDIRVVYVTGRASTRTLRVQRGFTVVFVTGEALTCTLRVYGWHTVVYVTGEALTGTLWRSLRIYGWSTSQTGL